MAYKDITQKDLKRYRQMIKNGQLDEAIDDYIFNYVNPSIDSYNDEVSNFLREARQGQLSGEDNQALISAVSIATVALTAALIANYNRFANVQADIVLANIQSKRVQKEILRSALDEFDRLTRDAMSKTQQNVLSNIREMQRAYIIESTRLRAAGIKGEDFQVAINKFKRELKNRFPDYYELEKNRNFLKTRLATTGGVRNLKLNNYADMAIRTSILNIDRTSEEVEARIAGDLVVEYYEKDSRKIKTKERKICKQILRNKINGKSLLALDQRTADKLGILTVNEAKITGDRAMGPNCRHGIRKLPKEFNDEIREMTA